MNSTFGTYEYITADYVMAGAKMRLGIKDTTEDDLLLLDIINQGSKRLRSLGNLIPMVTTLPITSDLNAKLPEGFVRFNHPYPIVYVNENGTIDINAWMNVPQFINNTFFTDSPETNPDRFICGGTVNVVNGYLWFSSNVTAHFVKIVYLSTNITEEGQVAIPAIAEDSLLNFTCWQYGMTFPDKYNQYILSTWEQQWKSGKKQVKGIFAQSDGIEWPYITYKMKSLV